MKLSIFYSLVFSFFNLANAEKVLNQKEDKYCKDEIALMLNLNYYKQSFVNEINFRALC